VIVSSIATGTAPFTVTSTTQVANLNVATAGVAGTVSSAAQPNITSVGTLSGLTVSTTINGSVSGSAASATTAGTVTTAAQPNITSTGTLTGMNISGPIVRTTTTGGWLSGNYSGVETAGSTGAIYTIGGSYVPSGSSLSTMYGIGYGYTNTSAANIGGSSGAPNAAWGMYVCSSGISRIFLNSDNGYVYASGGIQTPVVTTGSSGTAGTITGNWTLSAGSKWNATYADLSEKYVADAEYEPGTVLVFGGEQEVTLSTQFDSTRVAGVVTTNPAYTMNSECPGEFVADIALQGRVPVKVVGPVFKGDLLVSAGNGHAIANNEARAGTIIGKSLANFNGESGIIEVAVGRF
jgi:hypothetical protein